MTDPLLIKSCLKKAPKQPESKSTLCLPPQVNNRQKGLLTGKELRLYTVLP
jgi:hypothetical protein